VLDDRKLQSLIAMYDAAIAELRSLDDRGVEAFIARLEAHRQEMTEAMEAMAARTQHLSARYVNPFAAMF